MKKRFISFVLVLGIVLGCVPAVSAAGSGVTVLADGTVYDSSFVDAWDSFFDTQLSLLSEHFEIAAELAKSMLWSELDYVVSRVGFGNFTPASKLSSKLNTVNSLIGPLRTALPQPGEDYTANQLFRLCLGGLSASHSFATANHSTYGRVIVEENTGLVLCDSRGAFPYSSTTPVDPDTGATDPTRTLGGKWVRIDKVNWKRVNLLSEYSFYDVGYALRDAGEDNDVEVRYENGSPTYEYLKSTTRYENGIPFIYCDSDGHPYVNRPDADEWAQENDENYYVDDDGDNKFDDGDTLPGQLIDLESNTVWFPDGTLNYIDNLIYDESTKTYYLDAHQEYDITNNTVLTFNYKYEYHINYTSVTYIGQTEEYDERYEFYYELPDGRSSADLTAEELQVLNTQIDVLPYVRSADDTSIRALYHFDGDCLDSSYWSHLGSLTWNKGASITYMDVGAFNGALYLDENAHDFTVTLPSILGTKDFTIQWRYYQSQTLAPSTDSSFSIGDTTLLQFNGSSILNAAGDVLSPVSVGNWQEIALVRKDGVITVFLNGVSIGGIVNGNSMDKTLHFVFGSDQQTYKYFDELRVVNKALYDTAYTPTSVPFDTNLALVLPDSQLPVADEYWNIKSSGTNLLSEYGLDWWTEMVTEGNTYFKEFTCTPSLGSSGQWTTNGLYSNQASSARFPNIKYLSTVTDISIDGGLSLTSKTFTDTYNDDEATLPLFDVYCGSSSYNYRPIYGLYWNVYWYGGSSSSYYPGEGTYTFSIVTENGEVTSLTFTLSHRPSADSDVYVEGNGYRLALYHSNKTPGSSTYYSDLAIQPLEYDKPTPRIVYMELVEGDSTDLSAEFVSSVVVMDKDDLNTPSLAVRTDIDITGYQLGGVRPSLPEKGLVWALIESGRVTSLQIYNGQAWEAVDGRIWTGSRWVPYYAYDVLLLKDLWDIVESDPTLDPIYTETGFWTWLQNAWSGMLDRLDAILSALGGSDNPGDSSDAPSGLPGVTCTHAYVLDSETPATCVVPGQRNFECPVCGAQYIEAVSALGHDWIAESTTPDTYSLPEDTACPDCGSAEFAATLDEADAQYSCTCNSCSKEWVQNALLVKGETTYACSLCGETYVGTEPPDSADADENWTLFDLGKILKDGIWKIIKGSISTAVGGLSGLVSGIKNTGGFFDAYDSDTSGGVLDIMNVGSEEFWS